MFSMQYVPLGEAVDLLERLCAQKASGLLLLLTPKQSIAQIGLNVGQVALVSYDDHHGQEAVSRLSAVSLVRYQFQEGELPVNDAELPAQDILFSRLREGIAPDGKAPPEEDYLDLNSVAEIDEQRINVLATCLAEYIGPFAHILVKEALPKWTTLSSLVDALAHEVPATEKALEFRQKAYARLGL